MRKELNSYEDFERIFKELEDRGMEETPYFIQYVLSPYMGALGYDVFDMDEVSRLFEGDTYKALGVEDDIEGSIYIVFSLGDYRQKVQDMDGVRAYVHINKETSSVTLYYNVLGDWYPIHESRLSLTEKEDVDHESANLVNLNRVVQKDKFRDAYSGLKERLFTGSVIDSLLQDGNLDNRFVRQALVDELTRPDSHMIKMLASKLMDYSTQDVEWLEEQLDGIKETGLVGTLERAINEEEIKVVVKPKSAPLPSVRRQADIKPNLEHKSFDLESAGFKVSKEEPKKDKPVREEKVKEVIEEVEEEVEEEVKEDKFGLGDLKDQFKKKDEEELEEDEEEKGSGYKDISDFFS